MKNLTYYHYYEYPGWHSVKRHEGAFDKRFKLIRYYGKDVENGEEWEFFDLDRDPSEMKSEYNNPEYAGELARMKKELGNLREFYDVPDEALPQDHEWIKPGQQPKKQSAKKQ
jgi:antirestriction protein